MDRDAGLPCRLRLRARPVDTRHAAGRHRRRVSHPPLLGRLHGARRGLLEVLRLPEPLHVLHADAGAGGEFPADVRRMGGRRTRLLPAHRLLLQAPAGGARRHEGLRREPHRRLRLPAGHVSAAPALWHAQFCRGRHPGGAAPGVAGRLPDGDRAAAGTWRDRQVGPDPPLRVAARCDGGPHPGLCPDPRRHHGHRRRLHDRPHARAV